MTDLTNEPDVDLFGNPINHQPAGLAAGGSPTNDMDLVQAVLADITDEKTPPLHHDAFDTVRRCATSGTTPVAAELAATVGQLIAAQYLTTTRRGCTTPAHGPVITTTQTGRAAVCRWRAYRRPSSWDVATGQPGTTNVGTEGSTTA